MAVEQQDIATAPVVQNAEIIGLEFVKQYYNVLVLAPDLLFKFYNQDRSILSRQSLDGHTLSVITVIEQHITSPYNNGFKVEIKTVDSQASDNNGVLVLVSGSIAFIDNSTRSFNHSLFLAPRENEYFVVSDIFMFGVEDAHQPEHNFVRTNGYPRGSTSQLQNISAVEQVHNQGQRAATQETPAVFQGAPEKSEAIPVKVDAATQTVALPSTIRALKYKTTAEESGCSIFISNLPADITPPQVEEEFKKYGAIKPSGVQVRTVKGRIARYAFVEFEDAASVQAAIRASPIRAGARKVYVQAKRPVADREGFKNDGPITENAATQTFALPSTVKDLKQKSTTEESRCSIFISDLPVHITPPQVEEKFKTYGAIKPSGVRVRTTKGRRSKYAFVEFEDEASAQAAVQASQSGHIRLGSRKVTACATLPRAAE